MAVHSMQSTAWTYASELLFIGKLGTFANWQGSARPNRAALLRGYIAGLDRRERGFTDDEKNALRRIAANLLSDAK